MFLQLLCGRVTNLLNHNECPFPVLKIIRYDQREW
jgi:hypothetical protein